LRKHTPPKCWGFHLMNATKYILIIPTLGLHHFICISVGTDVAKTCIASFYFRISPCSLARRHTFSKSGYALCIASFCFQICPYRLARRHTFWKSFYGALHSVTRFTN
jgi:hypothetical protein